jgi:hypothetical protein
MPDLADKLVRRAMDAVYAEAGDIAVEWRAESFAITPYDPDNDHAEDGGRHLRDTLAVNRWRDDSTLKVGLIMSDDKIYGLAQERGWMKRSIYYADPVDPGMSGMREITVYFQHYTTPGTGPRFKRRPVPANIKRWAARARTRAQRAL